MLHFLYSVWKEANIYSSGSQPFLGVLDPMYILNGHWRLAHLPNHRLKKKSLLKTAETVF